MQQNVLNTDLSGKVAVVTGAGGVLCSAFAKVLARAGAKVALLDLNEEAAAAFAAEIIAEGGTAKAYKCNVLEKEMCEAVADRVLADFGPCDILLNGAGGNNPRATTEKEYYESGDVDADDATELSYRKGKLGGRAQLVKNVGPDTHGAQRQCRCLGKGHALIAAGTLLMVL